MNVRQIDGMTDIAGIAQAGRSGGERSSTFGDMVAGMVREVNENQQAADHAIRKLATGESANLHEVMIAVEKASVSFQFLAQVRAKVVEAYQEIMRMPV